MKYDTGIAVLKGKILKDIIVNDIDDEIIFITNDDKRYKMYHYQDCCESVFLSEIIGNLKDLLDFEILVAEERESDNKSHSDELEIWTFYELATNKGSVTIRWCGTSNGYYSVSVYFVEW